MRPGATSKTSPARATGAALIFSPATCCSLAASWRTGAGAGAGSAGAVAGRWGAAAVRGRGVGTRRCCAGCRGAGMPTLIWRRRWRPCPAAAVSATAGFAASNPCVASRTKTEIEGCNRQRKRRPRLQPAALTSRHLANASIAPAPQLLRCPMLNLRWLSMSLSKNDHTIVGCRCKKITPMFPFPSLQRRDLCTSPVSSRPSAKRESRDPWRRRNPGKDGSRLSLRSAGMTADRLCKGTGREAERSRWHFLAGDRRHFNLDRVVALEAIDRHRCSPAYDKDHNDQIAEHT